MTRETSLLAHLPSAPAGRTGWPWTEEADPAVYEGRAEWPRISIVTPSFNQAPFLEETIRSVLLQNYPNLQYIVIDGGSADGSVEIIEKYAAWIDYWVSEKDRGQSHAINKGQERCDGEWRNWLNSDDFLAPGALQCVALAGESAGEAVVVMGGLHYLTSDLRLVAAPEFGIEHGLVESLVNHRLRQPAMFYRREVVGRLEEDLHLAMDFALWARVVSSRGMRAVAKTGHQVAVFRHHAAAKTSSRADGFELEERRVHAGLAVALGWSRSWVGALANLPVTCADKPKALADQQDEYAAALVRRYLAGDLRRCALENGFRASWPLCKVVAMTAPWTAVRAVASSLARRWFGRAEAAE